MPDYERIKKLGPPSTNYEDRTGEQSILDLITTTIGNVVRFNTFSPSSPAHTVGRAIKDLFVEPSREMTNAWTGEKFQLPRYNSPKDLYTDQQLLDMYASEVMEPKWELAPNGKWKQIVPTKAEAQAHARRRLNLEKKSR